MKRLMWALPVLLLAACSGDNGDKTVNTPTEALTASTATPMGTGTAQPTTVPNTTGETVAGVKVSALTFGAPGSLPVPLSVIIEKGCYQCDGPASAFERATLDSAGKVRIEQLFKPAVGYISSSNWDPAGKAHFLSVCSRGYCGGLGPISADAQTTIYRSIDGGVTWQVLQSVDGLASVAASSDLGVLLNLSTYTAEKTEYKYQVMGTDRIVRPPEGAKPETIDNRLIGWRMADGRTVQGLDGSTLLVLPDLGTHPSKPYPVTIEGILPSGDALISWLHAPQPNKYDNYIGISRKNGQLTSAFKGPGTLNIGSWLTQSIAFGNVIVPNPDGSDPGSPLYPAMIDFAAAKVNVLELYGPFGDKAYQGQRNRIELVEPGPFFRVTGAGNCLNVRETASTSAKTLGCYADNVLLRDLAGEEKSGNVTWKKVGIPGGQPGWASAEFLAR